MAEFPSFGRHCSFAECHQLDFLPVRCDACGKDFCASHFSYEGHGCESSYKKDVQVPVCPLCGKPVPVARGELPDERVGAHIDSGCDSDPARASRGTIYTNRCSVVGCRKRELVPVRCDICGRNFCIRHRFPADHGCDPSAKRLSPAALAALAREKQQQQRDNKCVTQRTKTAFPSPAIVSAASSMSEDEALARALEASLNDGGATQLTGEELDRALAEELQRMEYQGQGPLPRAQRAAVAAANDRCSLS